MVFILCCGWDLLGLVVLLVFFVFVFLCWFVFDAGLIVFAFALLWLPLNVGLVCSCCFRLLGLCLSWFVWPVASCLAWGCCCLALVCLLVFWVLACGATIWLLLIAVFV